jgi:CheY-like chemotaxis protein
MCHEARLGPTQPDWYVPAMSEPARRLPVILVVDDEPTVLAAVARDVRQGSGSVTGSSASAPARKRSRSCVSWSAAASRWRCWWPTSGCPASREPTTSCARASSSPTAKRVLLTAYADTEAAIQARNEVDLDYYLLKPWDPPEENLFPVVRDPQSAWEGGAALEAGRGAPGDSRVTTCTHLHATGAAELAEGVAGRQGVGSSMSIIVGAERMSAVHPGWRAARRRKLVAASMWRPRARRLGMSQRSSTKLQLEGAGLACNHGN